MSSWGAGMKPGFRLHSLVQVQALYMTLTGAPLDANTV